VTFGTNRLPPLLGVAFLAARTHVTFGTVRPGQLGDALADERPLPLPALRRAIE